MDLKLKGKLRVTTRDAHGELLSVLEKDNLIVSKGKEAVSKLLCGLHGKSFGWIQIGTGTTPPSTDDTSLASFYREAQALTAYEHEFKAKWAYTFLFDEAVTISEAGLFDDMRQNNPTMLARQTFSGRSMQAGQTMEILWVITVS